jgi:hypothetical protein
MSCAVAKKNNRKKKRAGGINLVVVVPLLILCTTLILPCINIILSVRIQPQSLMKSKVGQTNNYDHFLFARN